MGALTPDETLTPLGRHLAALPVDPRLGKLLLMGAMLGCLGPALTIAAAMSHRSPFASSFERQDDAARAKAALAAPAGAAGKGRESAGAAGLAAGQQSDHLTVAAAYAAWRAARCQSKAAAAAAVKKHVLSAQALEGIAEMRGQFGAMLADIRFVSPGNSAGGGGKRASACGLLVLRS